MEDKVLKTKTHEEIIKAVDDFPGGCKDQKNEFLRTMGIERPKGKLIVTMEIDLDKVSNKYVEDWNQESWQAVLGKSDLNGNKITNEIRGIWFDHFKDGVKVTEVRKENA